MKVTLIYLLSVILSFSVISQVNDSQNFQNNTEKNNQSQRFFSKEQIDKFKVESFYFENADFPLLRTVEGENKSENSYERIRKNNLKEHYTYARESDGALKNNQCNYIFECRDTYGDGWNGTQMQVKQNNIVVATLGIGFTGGQSFIQTVPLTHGIPFEVYWSVKGSWPQEVGLKVFNPDDVLIYHQVPICTSSQNCSTYVFTTIFTNIANCTPPACPKPTAVSTMNITNTSAVLQWTENAGATEWQIEYGSWNFVQGSGTLINTTSTPYLLNGLMPNANYKYYIRSYCNPTYSDWSGPFYFKTQCNSFSVPYNDDFESPVSCWTIQDVDGGGETWVTFALNQSANGNYSIGHSFGINGYEEEAIIISPQVILPDTLGIKLEFWNYNIDASLYGQNSLLISTDNWATYDVVWSPSSVSEQVWQKTTIDISAYANNMIQFGFKYQGANAHSWLVDNVSIYLGIPEKVLNLNVLLQGLNSSTVIGTMNQARNDSGPEFGPGIADKITVELRDATNPDLIRYQNPNVILKTDRTVRIPDVPLNLNGSYYIVVKHRNSIETWSASPVLFGTAAQINYSFTSGMNQAYGANLLSVPGGYYAIYSGDVNQDYVIDATDIALMDNAITLLTGGYNQLDANGDGTIDASDVALIDNNLTNLVQRKRP